MGNEGEEVQVKGIGNVFNKTVAEKFSNLKNEMPIQVQEVSRTSNRHGQKRTSQQYIIVKRLNAENK
jgi:hypothetical protein